MCVCVRASTYVPMHMHVCVTITSYTSKFTITVITVCFEIDNDDVVHTNPTQVQLQKIPDSVSDLSDRAWTKPYLKQWRIAISQQRQY